MKRAFLITGILFLNCCIIPLFAQQPSVQTKANTPTLSHGKLRQLIWHSPQPVTTFNARDLLHASGEEKTRFILTG